MPAIGGTPKRVAFCHLDLGVGGAERFIIDSAREVQDAGHTVHLFTSHFDPSRCFDECSELDVRVVRSIAPLSIGGYLTVVCALLRMFAIAMHLVFLSLRRQQRYDVIVVDQVSAIVPLLQWGTAARVVFYGHFPDQLLAARSSPLRQAYRAPIDYGERVSTGAAHTLLVNSHFTRDVYGTVFGSAMAERARVLYPCVRVPPADALAAQQARWRDDLEPDLVTWLDGGSVLLALNRFEAKKNAALAIRALHEVIHRHALSSGACARCRVVVAGGYDARLSENVRCEADLKALAAELEVEDRVVFLRNVSDAQRAALIDSAQALLYTPENEHFGIVPLEAMARGCPVIACDSGGPKETVQHTVTGFLSEPTVMGFANAMVLVLGQGAAARVAMRGAARAHVQDAFSRPRFTAAWAAVLAGDEGGQNGVSGGARAAAKGARRAAKAR